METVKVGIREFRADLAEYIASSTPVAVTRHGQTVGYFIPTQGQAEADLASLKKASKTLDRLLEAQGVDVEDVVTDFKVVSQESRPAQEAESQGRMSNKAIVLDANILIRAVLGKLLGFPQFVTTSVSLQGGSGNPWRRLIDDGSPRPAASR
ncbi:type II toxin-antitoxin system Phd/YefM family antitoxin [Polaromonas sp. P1(28)-13]|nr:type II toxin-antitoxin system Phd/YefM family antitoxin [Polaromonas sp. P1(28)-13]